MDYVEQAAQYDFLENVYDTAKQYCRDHMSASVYDSFAKGNWAVIYGIPYSITIGFQDDVDSGIILANYVPVLKDAFKSTHGIPVVLRFKNSDGETAFMNLHDLPPHGGANPDSKSGNATTNNAPIQSAAKAIHSMDELNDALDAAKQYFRERSQEATYEYYISDLKPICFEATTTITLQTRSPFIRKIVADRYSELLKEAFRSTLGGNVDLKFVVAPENDVTG